MMRDLHWLRFPECIHFKLAVLIYRCLHGLAPLYLSDYIQSVAVSNRRRLRSSSSSQLVIRRTRLSTVGDRAFPVGGSRLWNSLPHDVTASWRRTNADNSHVITSSQCACQPVLSVRLVRPGCFLPGIIAGPEPPGCLASPLRPVPITPVAPVALVGPGGPEMFFNHNNCKIKA